MTTPANAKLGRKLMKEATKRIEAKGIARPPKHHPKPEAGDEHYIEPTSGHEEGIDTGPSPVVQSGFVSQDATNHPGESQMTEVAEAPAKTKQEQNAEAALAKIAAKEAKLKAKQEAAEAREAEKAAKAAAREAIKQAREAERAAAASEPKAPRERTYDGSMLALADKVRAGVYVKGVNGQLRSTDELAIALESVPAKRMVPLLLEVLQIRASENPYAALNYGQQSMNLRNRLRGAIRKGAEVKVIDATSDADTVKITLDYVKEVRDAGGYTAEATKPAVEEKVDATA